MSNRQIHAQYQHKVKGRNIFKLTIKTFSGVFFNFEYISHCILVSTDFFVVIDCWVIVISKIWWIYIFSFVRRGHSDGVIFLIF